MVQDPVALKRIFLDNADAYPKAEVMLRMVRPAVGDSLFTAEGEGQIFRVAAGDFVPEPQPALLVAVALGAGALWRRNGRNGRNEPRNG